MARVNRHLFWVVVASLLPFVTATVGVSFDGLPVALFPIVLFSFAWAYFVHVGETDLSWVLFICMGLFVLGIPLKNNPALIQSVAPGIFLIWFSRSSRLTRLFLGAVLVFSLAQTSVGFFHVLFLTLVAALQRWTLPKALRSLHFYTLLAVIQLQALVLSPSLSWIAFATMVAVGVYEVLWEKRNLSSIEGAYSRRAWARLLKSYRKNGTIALLKIEAIEQQPPQTAIHMQRFVAEQLRAHCGVPVYQVKRGLFALLFRETHDFAVSEQMDVIRSQIDAKTFYYRKVGERKRSSRGSGGAYTIPITLSIGVAGPHRNLKRPRVSEVFRMAAKALWEASRNDTNHTVIRSNEPAVLL